MPETKAGRAPGAGSGGAGGAGTPWRCRASRAGGSGWPVSSAHRWLFRLSRALDLNLLLIHGSCSPSAAQLKARRRRRRRMKGGTAASCGPAGGSRRRAPTPGLAAGPAEAAVEGRREGKGGWKKKKKVSHASSSSAGRPRLRAAPTGTGQPPRRARRPGRPLPRRGARRRKLQRLASFACDSTAGWGDGADPAKGGGAWDPRGSGHRGGGFFWVPQTRVVCEAWRSTPSVGAAQTGFPATAESF